MTDAEYMTLILLACCTWRYGCSGDHDGLTTWQARRGILCPHRPAQEMQPGGWLDLRTLGKVAA